MKKIIIYLAGFLAILSSCSKEMDAVKDTTPRHNVRIIASVKNADTKTTANVVGDKAQYVWQEDEKIKVIDASTTAKDFTLSDAVNGYFDADDVITGEPQIAVSPYSALTGVADYSPLSYSLTLPADYTNYVPGTTNDVMIGTKSDKSGSDYKFEFKHAAAVMKVTYNNVPIGTKKFVLTADKNINGTFSGLDSETPVLETPGTGTKTTTLTLEEAVYEANQSMDFYVPVPVATYGQFDIALKDGSDADIAGTVKQKKASTSLAKADYFATPAISLVAAAKGSNWNYTFTQKEELVAGGKTVNGRFVTSSPSANGWEASRGAQYTSGADPTISIANTEYVENVILVLSTNSGADKVKVTVSVDGKQLDEIQTVSTTNNLSYEYSVVDKHYRKGNVTIAINNSGSSSAYIKTVTINDKSPAGLSYDEPSDYSVLAGATFVAPTLNNPNSLSPITYSSDDTDVASVDSGSGAVTVKSKNGTATITASFDGNASYKAGSATYTITVADPYIDLPAATTPAKASCSDNATVTFDVDSNLDWTASKGTDTEGIIKSVSQLGNTVTVTFNANAAKTDKSAQVNITPNDDTYSSTATYMTVTQRGDRIEDVLTYSLIAPSSGTGYQTFSGKSYAGEGHSEAVYAGKICVNSDDKIQFNNESNAGIVTTKSGGAIEKVAITWYSGSNGLTMDVYGKNTAYSSAANLFNENKGTKLGSLVKGTNDELTIDGYYEYIGIVPATSGARYLSSITTTWGPAKADNGLEWQKSGSKTTTDSATMLTGDDTMPTATLYNPNDLTVSYSSSDTDVATINASTGVISLVGAGYASITATFAGDATYKPGTVSYNLTVTDSRTVCSTPTFSPVAGAVDADTNVTISSSTTGSTIYYTTDGSTPTTSSDHGTVGDASAVVTIDVAKTIKAIAVKDDCQTSSVSTAAYTISGLAIPLSDPSSVLITAISATGFTATWANDDNASGYSWMLSTSSTAPASTSDESVKAFGTSSDANLSAGKWTLNKTGLASLSGKYYFYVKANGDGVTSSDSNYSSKSAITLVFSLTSNPGEWPDTNSTTPTNYTYSLNGTDYIFNLKNVKQNSGYLMLTSTAALGLPAISGYKLVKVIAKNSGGCSTSTRVGISSSNSAASYISGGSYQTWSTTSSSYTYNLSATSINTMYYLYVTNKNAQMISLDLTYLE